MTRKFEDQEFLSVFDDDSAATFCDLEFNRCYFEGCGLSIAAYPNRRSTYRNIRMTDCSQRGCSLKGAIVEDVVVDGFDTQGQAVFSHGAVFKHVVLRGRIGSLVLSDEVAPVILLPDDEQARQLRAYEVANREYYAHVDWALDISQGEFKELDIRGIPARLVRRDPETQIVVTRQRALEGHWKDLPFQDEVIPTSLQLMLRFGFMEDIIVAPKRHRRFRRTLADFEMLRKAGIAEPD